MEPEEQDGALWLICPNGCPTEMEIPVRMPPAVELEPIAKVAKSAG
jgi:hypothetical protein